VTPHLVRVADETEIWSQTFDTTLADVLDLQAAIGTQVAQAFSLTISDAEHQRLAGRPPRDPRAYQLVLQALRAGLPSEAGRNALREAVRLDPAYGLAVFYLAAGEYSLIQTVTEQEPKGAALAEVRRLLDRAIALDSTLYDAYTIKAHLALDADWDLDGAQRQVDELLRRNPSYASGHELNAWLLERRGRHNEAIAAMREAMALDPLDPQLPVNLAWRFSFAGHFDSAEVTLRRFLRTHPDTGGHSLAFWSLGDALVAAGRPVEALGPYGQWSKATGRGNVSLAYLAWASAQAGQISAAQGLARELHSRTRDQYVSPVHLGIAWFAAGDTARARREFRSALVQRAPLFGWLDGHPVFHALHRDPVVDSLLAQAGGWRTNSPSTSRR
jgi:tetratricopeptide (TPR) repeat protein